MPTHHHAPRSTSLATESPETKKRPSLGSRVDGLSLRVQGDPRMNPLASRRSALRTAAGALIASSALRGFAAESTLRIGQIGTQHAHASGKMAALRGLPEIWNVIGLVEPDPARRSGVYEGLATLTEEDLLRQPDLHAVAVETAVEASCATAARCLKAGKHVHLDKPGALDQAEFRTMRLDAESRGLTVQMGYMLRFNPAFALLFRAVREGWLGEITEVDAAMGKLADAKLRASLGKLPGGGMFELACHVIDATLTILGKPAKVHAFSTPTQDDGFKDNQLAVLEYPRATATIRCNHADPFGGPRRRFSVAGTLGAMEIVPLESGKVVLSLSESRDTFRKGTQTLTLEVPKDRYQGEFRDLASVIRGESKFAWSAAHDIAVHETVLRAAGIFNGPAGS